VNEEDPIQSRQPAKMEASTAKRDIIVFLFFLFLSSCFWYINYLGKEMETDIKLPLKYTNLPENKVITADRPERLDLSIKGPGYYILRLKISGKSQPVLINLSNVTYRRVPDASHSYMILTSGLLKSLNMQMRSGCQVLSVKPDTVFFSLNNQTSRPGSGTPEERDAAERKK
jgi:hypothetical protein